MFKIAELLIVLVCCTSLLIKGQFINTGRPDVFDHPKPIVPGDCGPAKEVACHAPIHCKTDNNPGANEAFICQQTCTYCYTCSAEGNIKPVIKELCQKRKENCCSAEINPLVHFKNRNVDCGQYAPCKRTYTKLNNSGKLLSKTTSKISTAKSGSKKKEKSVKTKGSSKKSTNKKKQGGKKTLKKQISKTKKTKGSKAPKKK